MNACPFQVGDRVRVLNHDPWRENGVAPPGELLGTVVYCDLDGDILVRHDIRHPMMHDGGDRDPTNHGWWYYNPSWLELITLSINPELDLEEIL